MKSLAIIFTVIAMVFACSCSVAKSEDCIKKRLKDGTFYYQNTPNSYFEIHDTVHIEKANGDIYSKSKIVWTSCEDYLLIVEQANYTGGLAIGDTLHVHVKYYNADTLLFTATALGKSLGIKAIKKRM